MKKKKIDWEYDSLCFKDEDGDDEFEIELKYYIEYTPGNMIGHPDNVYDSEVDSDYQIIKIFMNDEEIQENQVPEHIDISYEIKKFMDGKESEEADLYAYPDDGFRD